MNEKSNPMPMMYKTIPAVAELNKVPGFDPLKFLRHKVFWTLLPRGVRSITVQAAVTATGTGLSGEKALWCFCVKRLILSMPITRWKWSRMEQ